MSITFCMPSRNRAVGFVWQHLLLMVALFLMTLGVVLCIKSDLGEQRYFVAAFVVFTGRG